LLPLRYHKLPELFQQRAKVDEERRKNEAFEASQSRTQQQKLREEKLKESEKQEDEDWSDWKNSWVKLGLMWLMDVIYIYMYNIYIHITYVCVSLRVCGRKSALFLAATVT
jgi:hypothetical protein